MSRFIAILNDINVLYTNSSLQVAVEAEGRRFKSLGPPPVFLSIVLFRNAPASNHQLVAEDLMEDGTI
jgi:hypothetical protein